MLAFIWILTAINLAGVRITGWVAVAMAALSLLPVVVLTAIAGTQLREVPWRPFAAEEGSLLAGLGPGPRDHDVELLRLGRAHHHARRDARSRARASAARCGSRCP